MSPTHAPADRKATAGTRSFFFFLEVLRDRWFSATLAFLLVAAGVAVHALYSKPVYESVALIQLDVDGTGADPLAELALAGNEANVAAELEVMRSFRIAHDAAVDDEYGVDVVLKEEHAYRPIDAVKRAWLNEPEPARISATVQVSEMTLAEAGYLREVLVAEAKDETKDEPQDADQPSDGDSEGSTKDERATGPRSVKFLLRRVPGTEEPETDGPEGQQIFGPFDVKPPQAVTLPLELATLDHRDSVRVVPVGLDPERWSYTILRRPMPQHRGSYRVRFDESGRQFEVRAKGSDEVVASGSFQQRGKRQVAELKLGTEARPLPLRLVLEDGDPAGRAFELDVRPAMRAAAWVQEAIVAKQVGQRTGIVNLGAKADDPYLAQRIAQGLVDSYLDYKQRRRTDQVESRLNWIGSRIAEVDRELAEAQDARDDYVRENDVYLLPQKASAAFEARSKLLEQRLAQEQVLQQETMALEALKTTETPERVMAAIGASNVDSQTQSISDSLVQKKVALGVELRQGRTSQLPLVRSLEAEIKELETLLATRIEALRREVITQFERRIEAVHSRLQQIQKEDAKHEEVLASLPEEERELARYTRDVETARKSLVFLKQMQSESEIAKESVFRAATQVDAARFNPTRQSPALFRRALIALFLGLFAAAVVALVRHLRDRTIRSPQDIEEDLGLQLYAAIPRFATVPRRERLGLNGPLVARDLSNSTILENYRTLRANLRFADGQKRIQALTITSALPREGKTLTTLNLAITMAKAGNRVIVVDTDLRKPMVNTLFGGDLSPGTVDVLLGRVSWREALQSTEVEGLSYIAAGRALQDPSALLETGRFPEMLAEMRQEFEYILFDVPPVLAVADAAAFFRSLDGVLLISREGACDAEVVAGARDQVRRFGGNLLGAVFNGFDAARAGQRAYGGYYGSYGSYGSGPASEGGDAHRPDAKDTQGRGRDPQLPSPADTSIGG